MLKRVGGPRGIAVVVACVGSVLCAPAEVSAAGHSHTPVAGQHRAAKVLWLARYHGLGYGQPRAMVLSPDGSTVFVTGFTRGGPVTEATTVAFRAATGARLWADRYRGGGPGHNAETQAIAVSPDGSTVYVTGEGEGYTTIAYNAGTGTRLWVRHYAPPSSSNSYANSVAVSPDGKTVFVTGAIFNGGAWATIAYNGATGARQWLTISYSGVCAPTVASSVAVSPSGSAVYVTGGVCTASGARDFGTVAYDPTTGVQLWASLFASPGGIENSAESVAVSPDGSEVFVQGQSADPANDYKGVAMVAYSAATGAQLWARRFPNDVTPSSVVVSPTASDLFLTDTSEPTSGGYNYATRAVSAATGNQVWVRRYLAYPGNAESIAVSPSGSSVFVTGDITVNGDPYPDFGTVAYNAASGAQLWTVRHSATTGESEAQAVAVSPDGSKVFVFGQSPAPNGHLVYTVIAYSS